jgi:hypothetical protein
LKNYFLRIFAVSVFVALVFSGCTTMTPIKSSSSQSSSAMNFQNNTSNYTSSTASNSSQQSQAQSNATSSESAQNASIPAFNGTVSNGKLPLINIPNNKWEQAKQDFVSEYPSIKSTMESVKASDFALSDNWHGILNKKPFKLNVYSLQAQFLLIVSEYGNNPAKIKLFISYPKGVFAFYGDDVWLMQNVKGIGEPLNIITDDYDKLPLQAAVDLDLEFNQLFIKLSTIEPEKRPIGTKLQIAGYNLLIMRDMDIVVINK